MWVVNQDGLAVAKVDALALDPAEVMKKDTKVFRVWGSVADHDFVMGAYQSLDEAKQVLEEFNIAVAMGDSKTFRMPEAGKVGTKNEC